MKASQSVVTDPRSRTRLLLLNLAAASLIFPYLPAFAASDAIGGLKWTARPVVVFSDSRDDPRVIRQIAALDGRKRDLDDRAIKIVREARPGSALRKRLGIAPRGFAVVLVGKDGTVKEVWRDPVDPKRIFDLIDQMPMRRDEMRG